MSEHTGPDREATPEELQAIETARRMAAAGIPIFVCPPNPYKPGKFFFKAGWQHTEADPAALDRWRPGWGVAAVGGGAADFLDIDPRSGGDESQLLLKNEGAWPLTYGTQSTPSGGTHHIISRTGERKETGFLPGIDFQAGAPEPDEQGSHGRAFVWLAPTVGRSKVTGELVPYRWVAEPDLEGLDEWRAPDGTSSDASTEGIVARVHAHRALRASHSAQGAQAPAQGAEAGQGASRLFSAEPYGGGAAPLTRSFTVEQARAFAEPHLQALREAPIGQIEERGMQATLALEHFVPSHLTAQQAHSLIVDALSHTAYDPNGPSDWTADKFLARLDGRRPVAGSWKATLTQAWPEPPAVSAEATADAVEALLAEMLTPAQIKDRLSKAYLIKGLLNLDSESWIIGAPGSRKSFVVLDMAAHVALGRPWQGRKVAQGPVVIIAAEGAGGLNARVRAWELEHGQSMPDNVRTLPRPIQVTNTAAWAVLVKACERLKPVMVVIDTQARATSGLDENSSQLSIFVDAMTAVRTATGACVIAIHHTSKSGPDARGHSVIDGAQETELKVVAVKGSMDGELRTEKQKDLPEIEPLPLRFAVHTVGVDEDGDPITSLALRGQDAWVGAEAEVVRPEAWEAGHAEVIVHLFKVLRDQGGEGGLTKSEARNAVIERGYGDNPKALSKSTWYSGWDRALGKRSAGGDPVMINVRGERWTVDPVALEGLDPREP